MLAEANVTVVRSLIGLASASKTGAVLVAVGETAILLHPLSLQ